MGKAAEVPVRVHRPSNGEETGQSSGVEETIAGVDEARAQDAGQSAREDRLLQEIESLKASLRELKKDFKRSREHAVKQQLSARLEGEEMAARALLPVVEALLRASEQYGTRAPELAEGIRLLQAKVEAVLASAGFSLFASAGEPFDPRRHEAMMVTGEGGVETVARVMAPGIARGQQVMVPARVVVGRSKNGE
ncbi:MAG: nucleotide exchange factor GrpE [Deltaproteobacteria bacterium]|nr:nucleotide exchange factor GrpE [Deltaproteobacteria bacterium]